MSRLPQIRISSRQLTAALIVAVMSAATGGCAARTFPKWEMEVHGGGSIAGNPSSGTATLPAPGTSFQTLLGTPSRRTASWYFGDGTTLLNQVNAALGVSPRITPLDSVLQQSLGERQNGLNLGFRLNYGVGSRLSTEWSLDYSLTPVKMGPDALAGIAASRDSFVPAFNALIGTGPFLAPAVTSVSTIDEGSGQQVFTTLTLNINMKTEGRVIPYAALGGGAVFSFGDAPAAELIGSYRFQAPSGVVLSETDGVTVWSPAGGTRPLGVFGGGVKYLVSAQWGLRFDARAYVSNAGTTTLLATRPLGTPATPGASTVTASLTTPSVQFSNDARLAAPSLTTAIGEFESFDGSGFHTQVQITAGWFLRF